MKNVKKVDCDYCFAEGIIFDGKEKILCPKCKKQKRIPKEFLEINVEHFDTTIYGTRKNSLIE